MLLNRQRRIPVPYNFLVGPNFATSTNSAKPFISNQRQRFSRVNAMEAMDEQQPLHSAHQLAENNPAFMEESSEEAWKCRLEQKTEIRTKETMLPFRPVRRLIKG